MNGIVVERKVRGRLYDKLDDMVEFWLAVEHNEMWKKKKMLEEAKKHEEETYVELSAPDMMSMLEKMKRITSMEEQDDSR